MSRLAPRTGASVRGNRQPRVWPVDHATQPLGVTCRQHTTLVITCWPGRGRHDRPRGGTAEEGSSQMAVRDTAQANRAWPVAARPPTAERERPGILSHQSVAARPAAERGGAEEEAREK